MANQDWTLQGVEVPSLLPLQPPPQNEEQVVPYIQALHNYLRDDRNKIARAIQIINYFKVITGTTEKFEDQVPQNSKTQRTNEDTLLVEIDTAVPTGTAEWHPIMAGTTLYSQYTKDPTGFADQENVEIGISGGSFFIQPKAPATSFTILYQGKIFTKTTQETLSLAAATTAGNWFIYYDSTGTLVLDGSVTSEDIIRENIFVAELYHDGTSLQFLMNEAHGLMPWQTHLHQHFDGGTIWRSGLGLTDIDADQNGSLDAHAEVGAATGVIMDEDIVQTLPTLTAGTDTWQILYRLGSVWQFVDTGTAPVFVSGGSACYNLDTGGVWSAAPVSNNKFFMMHVFATDIITDGSGTAVKGHVAIMGQQQYLNIVAAREGASEEIGTIVTSGLPMPEYVPVGTIIYKGHTAYANAFKAATVSTALGEDYVSWLGTTIQPGLGPSDHSNLTGRDAYNSHPASAIACDTTNFDGVLSGADAEVQSALDTIDDHTHVEADITDLDHTDANAIHDNVAGEFSSLTSVVPVIGDYFIMEDASDSNNKKKVGCLTRFDTYGAGIFLYITNSSGVAMSKGDIVYVSGDYNSTPLVTKADADAASTGTGMLMMCYAAIANGGYGWGIPVGTVNGFTGLTTGAVQYLSTTAGGRTQTAPSGSGDIVRVIGHAISTTEIYFNPSNAWVEIA